MINTGVSDLWFNHDKQECNIVDRFGNFVGYDKELMAEKAEDFIVMLAATGYNTSDLNADMLLEDFFNRI